MINSTSTGLGGRLYNRLRYMKTVERNEKNQDAPPVSQDVDPQHSMNELLWLKTVVVADEDIEEIRAKLDSTRLLRDAMVLRDDIELIQEFSLFFTHPLLVNPNATLYFDIVHFIKHVYTFFIFRRS